MRDFRRFLHCSRLKSDSGRAKRLNANRIDVIRAGSRNERYCRSSESLFVSKIRHGPARIKVGSDISVP